MKLVVNLLGEITSEVACDIPREIAIESIGKLYSIRFEGKTPPVISAAIS